MLYDGFNFSVMQKHKSKTTIKWSKRENDFLISWEKDYPHNMYHFHEQILDKEFLRSLTAKGYDIKTLKFEVKKFDDKVP
jgi:hypothetical protein